MEDKPDLKPYRGFVDPAFRDPTLLEQLRALPERLAPQGDRAGPFQRSRVLKAALARESGPVAVAVKAFPPQGAVRSLLARAYGSKARRSFDVAAALFQNGIGTPRPVGFLERWERGRLVESYFLTEFTEDASTFRDELIQLFHFEFQYDKVLNLMDCVAASVRAMHDADILHGDLGNQNILLRRKGPEEWGDVSFIDVNRGRAGKELSLRERAFDLSRLTLPTKLHRFFHRMYFRDRFFAGARPPRAFVRWNRLYRLLFALHTVTRPLRHPFRMMRQRKLDAGKKDYPAARDLWIWDARSDQAIGVMPKTERYLYYFTPSSVMFGLRTLAGLLPAALRFRGQKSRAYQADVALENRVGMTINPRPDTAERERELLEGLGTLPLLVRYYRHETAREWDFTTGEVRRLHGAGYPVSVALVQDRRAVRRPERWQEFVRHVLDAVGDIAEWVEVGHATNRTKWGVWTLGEYLRLLEPLRAYEERFPSLRFMGPAINDFEFHYVAATLGSLPRRFRLHGLSLHLYVDRRGHPENRQHAFSSLDKFVLARVLARQARRCDDRVIVSEVNWWLKDPGGHAHPFAPYAEADHEWEVTEDMYADYMLRYYLHALCSGMVDKVFWWRLVAAPFGLVDDRDDRTRPAYHALRLFLEHFGKATFVGRIKPPGHPVYLFRFRQPDRGEAVIGFHARNDELRIDLPFQYERAIDALGKETEKGVLTGRPVYFLNVR
jgi:serine/threonine protein kinase